ncbi:hypothetical protein [uncultured Roseibium sp.]|uniref:hypothetical protein n=1 Tax=uncultured Roseibium sp. TaxID=1936171 RepID=UPI002627C46E|nr:hypothetical protein [uncultured Roseibium sp.]
MKNIDKPIDPRTDYIKEACTNSKLKSYPKLLKFSLRAERIEKYYDSCSGSPNIIFESKNSKEEKDELVYLYDNPPNCLSYIGEQRNSEAGETCPMCGGYFPTTLDHFLPKKKYSDYALLPYNLVPACDCNQKRGDRTIDHCTGARVLHPFYDSVLSIPLIRLEFDPSARPPRFKIQYLLHTSNPHYINLDFHVKNVLLRTSFLEFAAKKWSKIRDTPRRTLPLFDDYCSNNKQFNEYLINLYNTAAEDDGVNSWKAILYRSVAEQRISDWLFLNYKRTAILRILNNRAK